MTEDEKTLAEEPEMQESDLTNEEKLWAALSWIPWIGWVLAVVALFIEPQKNQPFVRYHAVQAIGASIVLAILSTVMGITVILACLAPFIWLATIYPAIKAYQGEKIEIPWLTGFCQDQGWIE